MRPLAQLSPALPAWGRITAVGLSPGVGNIHGAAHTQLPTGPAPSPASTSSAHSHPIALLPLGREIAQD